MLMTTIFHSALNFLEIVPFRKNISIIRPNFCFYYFRDNYERLKKLAKSPGCLENGNHPEGNFCNFTEFLFFGKFHLSCSKKFEMFNSNRGLLSLKSNRGYNYYDEKNCAFCLMHRDVFFTSV